MHEFDKCIVISKNGVNLAEGFVHEFEGESLKVCANGSFSVFASQDVSIYIFNRIKGECLFSGKIKDFDDKNIYFTNVKFIRSEQKRDNTRVNKSLHYRITNKFEDKKTVKIDRPIDIIILNISAQGMYISCNEKFSVGYRFPLVFKEAGRPIDLDVEILRCEENRGSYRYGCRFNGISEKNMDNIYRFVLHEQIEQRRRNILF